jgi:hypothetical protein
MDCETRFLRFQDGVYDFAIVNIGLAQMLRYQVVRQHPLHLK